MSQPAPFNIERLDHVVIRVRDLTRSLAFYQDVLGCQVERRLPDLGLHQLRAGNALIDLVPVDSQLGRAGGGPPDGQHNNLDHFCLRITPWEETRLRNYLADHGVATEAAANRYGADGTGPSIYVADPDGNTVELKGPPQATDAT